VRFFGPTDRNTKIHKRFKPLHWHVEGPLVGVAVRAIPTRERITVPAPSRVMDAAHAAGEELPLAAIDAAYRPRRWCRA
jgi:hypothetical protein